MNITLRILGITLVSLSVSPPDDDDTAGDPGPGASADVTLAPGFVPPTPWWDDE